MEYRQLGRSGFTVPVLSLGTGTFGGGTEFFKAWGSTDANGATRLIDVCLDAGLSMFDSADVYSKGIAEEVLGAAIMGGGNIIQHAAGWMEGGLVASYEKFVLDVDLLQMVTEFLKPLEVSKDTMGFDAIMEVGPGGHFFGAAQTMERYSSAFYAPLISDWRNFPQWQAAGSPQAHQKANALWKQALAEYETPYLEPSRLEAIDAFVAKRTQEGGEPTDF